MIPPRLTRPQQVTTAESSRPTVRHRRWSADLNTARHWYSAAATGGNVSAMYDLGTVLATRLHPPDNDTARYWFEKAAMAGHVSAMYNLGYLLADHLTPADLNAARRWYEQAATAGHTRLA
jgi:TPR repeat protein